MKSLKKSVLFVLMAVFAAMLAITPARAQSQFTVNVPFDFVVGDHSLKAGDYTIETSQNGVLSLSAYGQTSMFALGQPAGRLATRASVPYLVFTKYGNEAFLTKVVSSDDNDRDLLLSNREKQHIAQLESGEQVAVPVQSSR